MISNFDKILTFFFILIPIFLITGPAIPDIIISLCGIYFLFSFIILKKKYNFLKDKIFIFSILFWLSILFISVFAYNKITSFQDSIIFLRFLIIPTIGFFLFLNTHKKIYFCIIIIFFTVCFVAIDSLYQFINYQSETGFGKDLLGFKTDWYGRLTGPFGDELVPGAYLSKFSLLGYIFFLFIKNFKYKNILEISYLSIIGLICFGSGERMALATYFMAIIFLMIFLKDKRFVFISAFIISIFLIFITVKNHSFYNDYKIIKSTHLHQGLTIEKYYNCEEKEEEKCKKIINLQPSFIQVVKNFSSSAYGEIYIVGLSMWKDNLFTGVGISNYQKTCLEVKKYNELMINYKCASHPHNTYIQWLSEGGLITLLSFIIFLLTILYFIYNGVNGIHIKLISFATLLIIFWPIMSTGSLIKNWNGSLSFYIIGICICISRVKLNLK